MFTVADAARRHGLRIACGCVPRRERSLRRSSSPKKVTPRLCCSLVNALATRRLATNFFRYQADRVCVYFFQSMQCPSVERTFCNLLYVYGRGRRRCGGPTILAIRCCAFPLVGNAHRAFRGGKLVRMIFGRSTGKHKIDGTNTQCNYFNPCNVRPSNARFAIFFTSTVADAAGAAALRFWRLGVVPFLL